VRALRHWLGGKRVKVKSRSPSDSRRNNRRGRPAGRSRLCAWLVV